MRKRSIPGWYAPGGARMLPAILLIGAATSLASCSSTSPGASVTHGAPSKSLEITLDRVAGGPRFAPENLTVPAGTTIHVRIVSSDVNVAPLLGALTQYDTSGGVRNLTENGTAMTSVPNSRIAHTWTIPALGINVPILAASRASQPVVITFTFSAPSQAGSYTYQCFTPCGTGANGMGGPMAKFGFMKGTLTVA